MKTVTATPSRQARPRLIAVLTRYQRRGSSNCRANHAADSTRPDRYAVTGQFISPPSVFGLKARNIRNIGADSHHK